MFCAQGTAGGPVTIIDSTIRSGASPTASTNASGEVRVFSSVMEGAAVQGGVSCVSVVDEQFNFFANACP